MLKYGGEAALNNIARGAVDPPLEMQTSAQVV